MIVKRTVMMGALSALLLAGGCVTGPFRTRLVGPAKSATVEWAKGNPDWLIPFMGTWGVLSDVMITAGDTAFKIPVNLVVGPLTPECNLIVGLAGVH